MRATRARVVYAVALFAYVVAVMQRTSFGVAGVEATVRFDASAAALSSIAVVQLMVYAAMQVPVGVMIDRLGPKVLLVAGSSLMLAGQLTIAFAGTIPVAVLARVLLGVGDAMIFVSVLRLVASWFPPHRVAVLQQWTGNVGQLGQVLSAVPFALLLARGGWQNAFVSAAAASALAVILIVVAVRDAPAGSDDLHRVQTWGAAITQLRHSLKRPGTQLGFWSHFTTQSSGTVFTLLWGFPFLILGLGYSAAQASAAILVIVASGVISGPLLGLLSARYPYRRSNLVLGIVTLMGVTWALVLLWPGEPPLAVVILLLVSLGIGGPGSLIGFDFARTFNPSRSLGVANGVVNVGGFLASFVMMFLIGVLLDVVGSLEGAASGRYDLLAFRIAFAIQYVIVGIGVAFLIGARRRTRKGLESEGITVGPIWVALMRRLRRRWAP